MIKKFELSIKTGKTIENIVYLIIQGGYVLEKFLKCSWKKKLRKTNELNRNISRWFIYNLHASDSTDPWKLLIIK